MFAVIKTGGKQYKVAKDTIVTIEKLAVEAGETVEFDEVLMIGGDSVTIGAPTVAGAVVKAEVLEQTRGEKVISFKKRRRKHSSQRRRGHRQHLTVVKVTDIVAK
jgi:large subunit ribosomal protein L21